MVSSQRHIVTLFVLAFTCGLAGSVRGQFVCDDLVVERAESRYALGWFREALDELQPCLREGAGNAQLRASALRLAALSHIALDSPDRAREIVAVLVRENPGYRPDPESDNLAFQDMVNDMKPRWYTWLWRGNQWYRWVGRGALASGVVMVPLLLRSREIPDLPEAPLDPQ